MTDQQAAELILPLMNSGEDQTTAARTLVEQAIARDTADNVTAVVIYL